MRTPVTRYKCFQVDTVSRSEYRNGIIFYIHNTYFMYNMLGNVYVFAFSIKKNAITITIYKHVVPLFGGN